jgi:hypothetical protein
MNQFIYKDTTVTVNIQNEPFGHYAETDVAGVKRKYTLMQFYPDFNRKNIRVEYNILFYDQNGNEISTPIKRSYSVLSEEFDQFYGMPVVTTLGHAISFNLINGMLFCEFGVRCFHADGSFYQPVVFDVDVEANLATATVHNGQEPFEVSLDGQNWVEGLSINLNDGENRFLIRDANGIINYKDIYHTIES